MQDINQQITNTYTQNLAYLQEQHKYMLEKLSSFENALDNNHYQKRYELVFENGGFDIFIYETQSYLYQKKPIDFLKPLLQSINSSKTDNAFIALDPESPFYTPPQGDLVDFGKFIFFGIGTGEHIEQIHNKIDASCYFIVEDELELFYLSLMTTPYYKIAQTSELFFAILETKEEFLNRSNIFLEQNYHLNHSIKFLKLPYFTEEKVEQFHTAITTQSHLHFHHQSILEQYIRPLYYLQNNYNFLNILAQTKAPILANLPVILLAPGPSLMQNIAYLQKHQKYFCLVALSAVLPILQKHSIVPDIITHVDGFERSKAHFDALPDLPSYLKDTPILLSARTPLSIAKLFQKEQLFFFENATNYKKDFGSISAFCAGSSSYLLLIAMQVKELYLLGLDLALDQKTLATHADGYLYTQQATQKSDTLSFRDSIVYTKGNFSKELASTPNFLLSIKAINEITQGLKTPQQQVYNLSNGANFDSIEPFAIQQLQTTKPIDKDQLKAKIIDSFHSHSQDTLTQEEKKEIEIAKNNALALQESLPDLCTKDNDHKTNIIAFSKEIANQKEQDILSLIIDTYLHTTLPHIFLLPKITQEICHKLEQDLLSIIQMYIRGVDAKYQSTDY
jgi:hypothetical protein